MKVEGKDFWGIEDVELCMLNIIDIDKKLMDVNLWKYSKVCFDGASPMVVAKDFGGKILLMGSSSYRYRDRKFILVDKIDLEIGNIVSVKEEGSGWSEKPNKYEIRKLDKKIDEISDETLGQYCGRNKPDEEYITKEMVLKFVKDKVERKKKEAEDDEKEDEQKKREEEERQINFKEKSIYKPSKTAHRQVEIDGRSVIIDSQTTITFKKDLNKMIGYDSVWRLYPTVDIIRWAVENKNDFKYESGENKFTLKFSGDKRKINGVVVKESKFNMIIDRVRHSEKTMPKEKIEMLNKMSGIRVDVLMMNEITLSRGDKRIKIPIEFTMNTKSSYTVKFLGKEKEMEWTGYKDGVMYIKKIFTYGSNVSTSLDMKTLIKFAGVMGMTKEELFADLRRKFMILEI